MARLVTTSEPKSLLRFLLTFALISVSSAGPSGQRTLPKCASFCGEGKNFRYEPGTTYVYDYSTDLETFVGDNSPQQRSHVRVTAKAEVEAVSSCDLKLQLKNVQLEDLTSSQTNPDLFKEHKTQLEQYSLLFGFQDGKIEEICANHEEDVWVVNVKRGIISMLQNSMDDLSTSGFSNEIDINGRCPTEYIMDGESWGGAISFKKIKDLNKCTGRQTGFSGIQSVPYSSSSPIQNIPLLNGKLECTQTVRNSKIEKIHCEEEQTFQPFESRSSAVNRVVQSLEYISEHAALKPSSGEINAVYVKKSLLFESFESANAGGTGEENFEQVLLLLENLERVSFPTVTPKAPQMYTVFVDKLRTSNENTFKLVYEAVKGTNKEKYLMEALPLISSSSSLSFLRDLALSDVLTEEQIQTWLTSLAFIKYPTANMIKAVAPMLYKQPTMEALLGISSLINSYCKENPSCNQEVVVNEILEKITSDLGTSCHVTEGNLEELREIVLRLKALGNAGVLPITEEVSKAPLVMKCIKDVKNPAEVRLAAIDSLRRLSCPSYNTEELENLFVNIGENTEIRIRAFLAVMNCANRQTIELVKSVLYTESVNQVASFVWTYMTNLQETNRPEKQSIRDLVSNEFLKNKFSTDARKFSRNYEASTYWEEWNIGGGLDSNIIFTEESFLPKTGMLNLTVQLFGQSVNLLEFGVRANGLEQILEKVFGPQGYFPDNRVTDFLESSRVKRDVEEDDNGLRYLYEQAKGPEQVPGGSFYTRIFGNELLYKNFHLSDKTAIPSVVDDTGKSYFNIRTLLNNLSTGKSSEFSKSSILLDSSYVLSTSSGFPLGLGIQIASTMSLVANGKFSVGKFMESRELDIHGTVKPSTVINVDGTLAMQIGRGGNQVKSGLKLHNSLRSSTALEMSLLMKGKDLLHAKLDFPQNKHEIIDMTSELYVVAPQGDIQVNERNSEEINEIDYATKGCSASYISDIFGMKLCLEMDIPSKFSFTPKRPAYFIVYMEKTDEFTGYTINYKFDSDASTTKLNAVFDTPQSRINRRIAADFLLDRGMGKIAGSLESVAHALRAEAVYTQFHKNFELSWVNNEKTSFLISTGLRSDGNVMKPHFLVTWHSRPLVDLKGSIDTTPEVNNEGKTSIEMNLKHLTETPVKISGEITGSSEMKEASLSIESYILTGNVHSQFKRKPGHWSTKTSVDYSWKRGKVHTGDISAKLQRSRKGTLAKYLITAGMSTTQFPDQTFDFHWETQASHGFCENSLKTSWGKTTWEGHTLFSQQYQFDFSELRLECSLASSKYNVDYRWEFAHRTNTEGFSTKALGRLGTGNEAIAHIEYLTSVNDLLRKSLEAGATWPNTEYTFKALFFEKDRGDFEAEVLINLNKTRDLKATALYINRSNNLKLDHTIEFRARGFTSVPFSGSLGLTATEKQTHIGCQVQFEGKKPYSSRMSTSIDYSHSKYTHRLEGKVTLNEMKYSGEIFYGSGKTGAKNLTVDLQLENHIFLEATLSGMLPNPMVATLLVIPDKDTEPNNKLQIDGNLDSRAISLGVHYFGEEVGFAGRYDDESLLVEAVWPEEKKIVASFVLPKFSLAQAQIEIDILTPFEGYKNITFVADHSLDEEKVKTKVAGGVEDSLLDLNIGGVFTSKEMSIATELFITGLPKYEGNVLVLRKNKRKSFQVSVKADEKESLFDFDFIHLDEGYVGKFNFFGCPFFNKVAMEVNHQFSSSQTSSFFTKFEWGDNSEQISLFVKNQNHPLTIESKLITPWTPAKEVVASLTWDPDRGIKQLSLTSKQDADTITANMKLVISGTLKDFRHELDGEYYGQVGRLTISGGLEGFTDSNFHSVLNLPSKHISFDFLSKKEGQKYIGEFKADVDAAVTTAGVKWDFTSEITPLKLISFWGQSPKIPPISTSIEYTNSNGRNLKLKIIKSDESVLDMETNLQLLSKRLWFITFALKSELSVIPSISFSSNHNLEDLNELKHTSTLEIIPKHEPSFWLNRYNISTRKVSVDASLTNLEDIKGAVIFGDKDFILEGKVDRVAEGYKTKVKISSNQFHELEFQGLYNNEASGLLSTGQFVKKSGEVLLKYSVEMKQAGFDKSGKFSLESKLTSPLNIFARLNTEHGLNTQGQLTYGQQSLIDFSAVTLISPQMGRVESKLSSTYFTSISNLKLNLQYEIGKASVESKIALHDGLKTYTASLESNWADEEKFAKLSYKGSIQFAVEGMIEGLSQLKASAQYNEKSLGEIAISYRPEMQGEQSYSYGKHGIYMTYVDSTGLQQDFNVIVGADSKKIYLNLQTPIEDWTNVVVDGQITPSSTGKGLKFLLEREAESIEGSFESKNSRKTGTLQLYSDLSVVGFSKLRQMLLDTAQIEGLSATSPQKFTFQLVWATNNLNVKVETPVDFMKKLLVQGSWELKKPQKSFSISGQVNDKQYKFKTEFQNEEGKFEGNLNMEADTLCKLQFDYDFNTDYKANLALEGPNWNVGGKVAITQNSFKIDVITPLRYYHTVSVTLSRSIQSLHQGLYSISWDVDGDSDKIELKYEIENGRVELRGTTPFQPWNSVVVTVIYDTPFQRLAFHSQRGDGQEIKLNFEINSSGNMTDLENPASSSILVAIESPLEHFEDIKFSLLYDRNDLVHVANLSIIRNDGETEGKLNLKFRHSDPVALDISAYLSSPALVSKATAHASLLVDDPSGESTISAHVQANGKRYEMYGSSQLTPSQTKFEMRTSLQFLRQLKLSLKKASSFILHGLWSGHGNKVELHGDLLCQGLTLSKISFNVSTPQDLLGSFGFDGEIVSDGGTLNSKVVFQNHEVRWLAKLSGTFAEGGKDEWRLQINTPLVGYKHVVISLKHRSTPEERHVLATIQLNKKEMSMKVIYKDKQVQIVLSSELSHLPIQTKIDSDWRNELLLQIETNAGNEEYGAGFNLNLQGIANGFLEFSSSSLTNLNTHLDWDFEGDRSLGQGVLNIRNTFIGSKSLRSSWKNEAWKDVQVDIWVRSGSVEDEKGFTIQYKVTPHTSYGSIQALANYTLSEGSKSLKFQGSLDKTATHLTFDSVLKTPFTEFQTFDVKGNLTLKNKIEFKIETNMNEERLIAGDLNLSLAPLKSQLVFNLDLPLITDPLELVAVYDIATESKLIRLLFKQNVYVIDVQLGVTIPKDSYQIDINLGAKSTVPSLFVDASGDVRMEYAVSEDGARQLSFNMKGNRVGEWKLLAIMQATSDIHTKIIFEGPFPPMPTLMAEFNLGGNIRQGLQSELTLILDSNKEYTANFLYEKGSKIELSFKTAQGQFFQGQVLLNSDGTSNLNVNFNGGTDYKFQITGELKMLPETKQGSGSVVITSGSNTQTPLAFEIVVENQGNIKAVGSSNEKQIKVEAILQGVNGGSWLLAGNTFIKVEGNVIGFKDDLDFVLNSQHYFRDGKYSLNATTGDEDSGYTLETYLATGESAYLFGRFEGFKPYDFLLDVKLLSSNVNVVFNVGTLFDLHLNSEYGSTDNLSFMNGVLTLNNHQSTLKTSILKESNNRSICKAILDIPYIKQKFDVEITSVISSPQNMKGTIDLAINDQKFQISGGLDTQIFSSTEGERYIERRIQITSNVTALELTTLGLDLFLRKPASSFSSVSVTGALTVNEDVTTLSGGFEIPGIDSTHTGIYLKLESSYFPVEESYEFFLKSFGNQMRKVEGKLNYKLTKFDILWDLILPTNVVSFSYAGRSDDGERVSFEMESVFNPKEDIQLNINSHGWDTHYIFKASLSRSVSTTIGHLFIDAPRILTQSCEYKITVTNNEDGSYNMAASAVRGRLVMELVGEAEVTAKKINTVLKAMGSYGSHYVMLVGGREAAGEFGFEITAESSSLLVGKRVNIRGNLTFDGNSVHTNLQCRALRNIHELRVEWRRARNGGNKFSVQIDSPVVTPTILEAEWTFQEKVYQGKLGIQGFGKVHQAEFGLNLRDFEGKLHIISPLLPSNEFNFHMKSIVLPNNIDILGDIRIRGAHWKFEGVASFSSIQDMSFKLETRTPFDFLDRVTFGVKSTREEIYFEMHTPSTYIPNLLFKLEDLIQGVEQGLWYKLKPSLIISVPNGKYAAMASMEVPNYETSGILHVMMEYLERNDSYIVETYMELSPLKTFKLQMNTPGKLELKLATPFDFLRLVEFTAEGEINNRRSGKLQITSGFNSLQGKFQGSFDNTNGNMQAATRLLTNIPGYEKSAFAFAIETFNGIGDGKSFHVEFIKPDWERQLKLDADYRYMFESFLELEGEININMDSYMNVPPLHSHVKSGMKEGRYSGVISGNFGSHNPKLKIEQESAEGRVTVQVEAKAGEGDRYNLLNSFEMIQMAREFSLREKLHWKGNEVLNTEVILSNEDELLEGHLHLESPWGPVHSKAVLTPITFLTMNEDLSFSQLLKNSNTSFEVLFKGEKILGLEIVSKDGMRLFEVHNPIRPVSLSIAVEKMHWNALRMKAGICWDLKIPEKSSIGLDLFMYRRSTGLTLGGYLAGANYGIITGKFEHFLISSKIAQNFELKWNGFAGRNGNLGYSLNITDKSTGFKKQVDYGLELVGPTRTILIEGGCTGQEEKHSVHNLAISWDAFRSPEKCLKFNFTSQKSTTWRTTSLTKSLQIQHFTWNEPLSFFLEKILIHDKLKQVEFQVRPSSNPKSHFSSVAQWESGDWSSFTGTVGQPGSNIHLDLQYNLTEQNKFFLVKYMLHTGSLKVLTATQAKTSTLQDILVQAGDLEAPQTLFALNSQSTQNEASLKANLLSYQVISYIQKTLPYMELTLREETANKVQLFMGLPHPREILLKTSRSHFSKIVNDVNFLVRLNASNLLSTRLTWRPELIDEIAEYDWLRGTKLVLSNLLPPFQEISNSIKHEAEAHWKLLSTPVQTFLISFYEFSKGEVKLILKQAEAIREYLQHLYSKNAFYFKDITEAVYSSIAPIVELSKTIYNQFKSACNVICFNILRSGKAIASYTVKYYGRLELHIMKAWDDLEELLVQFWKKNADWITKTSEEIEEFIDALIEAFEGRIEMLEDKLMAVGFIKKIIKLYQEYSAWLDELPIDDYMTAIEDFFQVKVWDKLQDLFGPYFEAISEALDGDYLRELLETPPIPYIRFVLRQTKNALVRFWDVIEIEGKVKDLVRHALRNLDSLMQLPSWVLNYDFDSGFIHYDQTLSYLEWPDFTEYPRWQLNSEDTQQVNQVANFYYQVLDYIEHLKPVWDMRIRDILPPFGGFAMMAGDHHYYTFDKRYFRFAGDCSYVLVADLLQNGFSFIVNYETSPRDGDVRKKSYTIALPSHSIEFDVNDFKVTVDNRKTELPIKIDTLYIKRQETRLDIYDVRGYQIACTLSPSVCTFSTSGWYYGKLGGLLGTFDNEPNNDFQSADGQVISDIPSFAYSWRVGKERNQCRMKNFARNNEETEPADVDNICYDLLANRASPLRPCFNTVDTGVFMEMCKFDVSKNMNSASRPESSCTSMSAYVQECQKNNVDVWMPPICVRCKLEDGMALTTGENITLQTNGIQRPPFSSDIVILMEEQGCMDQIELSLAISKLEVALKAEGIRDNRYAIVGYGGKGIHSDAHFHTSASNVWSHSTLFKAPENVNISTRRADLYKAIHFASTMTFRAGVSKNLIAITCGDDKCGDNVRYADTLTLLVENDIRLHMLTPKPFVWKGEKKQDDTKVLGFDMNGAYTTLHAKRGPLVADSGIKRQLALPKDLCTPLAIESNGTRFTTDTPSKKMLDVWSRRIAQTSVPSECQRCECVPDRNGGSRFMCHQCVSPTLWKFLEEWKSYQSQEVDDMFGLEIIESEPFLLPPNPN